MSNIVGNGTIYYHHGKKMWVAEYNINEDGKIKKKSIYSKDKNVVSKKLTQIMYDYHNNNYIRKNGIKLIDLLKQNREDKYAANLISGSHYSRLEATLKLIEKSRIGQMDINQITARDLQDYFNSLINDYSDSSIKKVWECIKQGFEIAIDEKYILSNPFRKLRKPKSKKETKVIEAMTIDDEKILASYLLNSNLSHEKYKNAILIQLYAGLRVGEVLALTKNDIDFRKNVISVKSTVALDKDASLILKQSTKTYAGKREVPISPFLLGSLQEQYMNCEENPDNLLFTFEKRLLHPSTINTVLKRICKQLGLPKTITNHTLRHTFGTRCIESGMSPKVVQTLMGHKDISVTLNTYTSVLRQYKEEEFQKLSQYYITKNTNQLPGVIALDDYSVHTESNEYYTGIEENIYNAYNFKRDDIINLFGNEEKYKEAIKESWPIIMKWRNKIIDKNK